MKKSPKITIYVEGGVVQEVYSSTPAGITLIDFDNIREDHTRLEAEIILDEATKGLTAQPIL